MLRHLALALVLLAAGGADAATFAIVNARILGDRGIQTGTVVVRDDRIVAAGPEVRPPAGADIVDAEGSLVTAGLFDAFGTVGVAEVNRVDSTVDNRPASPRYGPALDLVASYNPRSMLVGVNLADGITHVAITPAAKAGGPNQLGQVLAGSAAIVTMGRDAADATAPAGVAFLFGENGRSLSGGSRSLAILRLKEALDEARDFAAHRGDWRANRARRYELSPPDLEALQPLIRGDIPLVAQAERASDIAELVELAAAERLRLAIVGGAEAWMVADRLASRKVPVAVDPTNNLPLSFEGLNATARNAALLHAAGVDVTIFGSDSFNARNIRQYAGNAVANGLPYEAALRAITSAPADLYGVGDRIGRLRPGYKASLVLWRGDPLEVDGIPQRVWVDGRPADLVNRQTLLRDRYRTLRD